MTAEQSERDTDFQSFMASRWPRLLRTAYLLTGEQHAAEDLAQTALERAYVAWRRVTRAEDPDAYVRRILFNAHARRFRSGRRAELPSGHSGGSAGGAPPAGPDRIAQADDRLALLPALLALPPRQRQAVVLRYWEDLSVEEAAAAMGCSTGTIKSQTAKGLAKLRVSLVPRGRTGGTRERAGGRER
ncbi:SigE family RNA polymerase sigma factor [Streptomyces sp. WAC 06738]|uniref:SigE family RNA polymerase sigma factor n=1 Tax=Streptomyces sp. WAC 06738 TaxID=2203210 RepID=UPI000F700A8D|nr:SigE family RNA polymerase sigma factor [Streptomyces sp. WAC 06738]AZM49755.1 SigE family RNA polymerase sigma factor [Streptomyces sp. WAC 06738]